MGMLVVLSRVFLEKKGTYWKCICDCGKNTVVFAASLKRGSTKSCGCGKKKIGDNFRKRPYEAIYNTLVRNLKGRELTISYEQFLEFVKVEYCHYCGENIIWQKVTGQPGPHRYNLDRKDNSIGYTQDNVVVCCKRCNFGKTNAFSYEEWVAVGNALKEFRERHNAV